MFGRKDSIREFEQMRSALKKAERPQAEMANEGDDMAANERSETTVVTFPVPGGTPATVPLRDAVKGEGAASGPEGSSSIVSSGSSWQGNLDVQGSVRIEGKLSGEIHARDTVYVAESAEADAKVSAAIVIIAGKFQGEVHCGERLEITPTGKVKAELTTKSLVVHEGAFIEGQVHMGDGRPGAIITSGERVVPERSTERAQDRPQSADRSSNGKAPATISNGQGKALEVMAVSVAASGTEK